MVDSIDNKILRQQVEFFSEIRHAYHEYGMVEEAIYDVAQNDELEISRQAEKIYEVLISDDPENELEKYYDIAPNSYLKEFAGISHLTREFGDRTVNGASLYLKNLNNITQEMQIEILKRDKLDYVFQSLSFIAAAPIVLIEPIKGWAVSQFAFTNSFYSGKLGLIVQTLTVIMTFICYVLIRKVKDTTDTKATMSENPWQKKAYKIPFVKRLVNSFIPKKGTKDYIKTTNLLKESASKLKIEWLYVNRLTAAFAVFIASIFIFTQIHKTAIKYVYEEPTTDYNLIGTLGANDLARAMEVTEAQNAILDKLRGKQNLTAAQIQKEVERSKYYADANDQKIEVAVGQISDKLEIINSEYMQWFELLLGIIFAVAAYYAPMGLLFFQLKMRQLEMEDEVMEFHTIILMLMKIERVNVEMMLEWLERYANIFKEPITTCLNNYEAGAWEALEEMKTEVKFFQFERIIESFQSAVEKIPIKDAFDELDTERAYYQEKRKESNERLISKKGMIGKVIGFAPMVVLFVLYLIAPLVGIGLMSMGGSMGAMSGAM